MHKAICYGKRTGRFVIHCLIPLALLLLFVVACDDAQATERVEGTLSALSTRSAQQGTEISGQAMAAGTVRALETENEAQVATTEAQATTIAGQATMISHLATRGPFVATPFPPGSEPTPYHPVAGSVTIEGGRCCVGSTVGEEIELEMEFDASSPLGEVTEMRVRLANVRFIEEDLLDAEWEPFVNKMSVPVTVALNWVRYYVSVQYRDDGGNLSPVYYDNISVEGSPP